MMRRAEITVPNSVVLVMGSKCGEIPESMPGGPVAATASSIVIGTVPPMDGRTEIILTDEPDWPRSDPDLRQAFVGSLDVPQDHLAVFTVDLDPIVSLSVSRLRCDVEVWLNDDAEPSRICVVVKS